jgi:hypothetical protein
MSSNIKFCAIIIVGVILFEEPFSFQQFFAASAVLFGIFLKYSIRHLNLKQINSLDFFKINKRTYCLFEISNG